MVERECVKDRQGSLVAAQIGADRLAQLARLAPEPEQVIMDLEGHPQFLPEAAQRVHLGERPLRPPPPRCAAAAEKRAAVFSAIIAR